MTDDTEFPHPQSFAILQPMYTGLFHGVGGFQYPGWGSDFPDAEISGPRIPYFDHDYDFHGYSTHHVPYSDDASGYAAYPGPEACHPTNYYSEHNYEPFPFGTPHDPSFHPGSDYAFYPARSDWSHGPIQGPAQVIGYDGYYHHSVPQNPYPSYMEGPAQFIFDNSMYCPRYMNVGPDAYNNDPDGVLHYDDYVAHHEAECPPIEEQPYEEHITDREHNRSIEVVQTEEVPSGTSTNSSEHYPVLPDPANGGQSTNFETWKRGS